jgi:hypothetical protein
MRLLLPVILCGPLGLLIADGRAKDGDAAAWLAAYEKLGGKGTLTQSDKGGAILSIEKRKGQKPLVSLKGLKAAPGVRHVGLQGFEVDDDDLEALAAWNALERIEVVDGVKVADKGVKAISRLPNLRVVELADTAISDEGIAAFSKHKKLVHFLYSNANEAGRARVFELKDMPKLETITLCGEGIHTVALTRLPQLREVCDFPRSVEVANFDGLGRVRDLDFSNTRLRSLLISDVPLLQSVDVRQTQLAGAAIKVLKANFPEINVKP